LIDVEFKKKLLDEIKRVNKNDKLSYDDIFFRIKDILSKSIFELKQKNIERTSKLKKDLGATSFDMGDAINFIKVKFDIDIEDGIRSVKKVSDLVYLIGEKLKEQNRFYDNNF